MKQILMEGRLLQKGMINEEKHLKYMSKKAFNLTFVSREQD